MEKKKYTLPAIQLIVLDNEISLVLESNPPIGPEEGIVLTPDYQKIDPFKTSLG